MKPDSSSKILIIDDEKNVRQSFSDHLEDLGYQVFIAKNGRVGLEVMAEEQPDLILTDLRMPEMGGLEVIKHALKKDPNMPIVVISGAGRITDAIEALRLGAWDYVLKPITEMSVLTYLVEKILEKKKILQENRSYQENLKAMVHEQTVELRQAKERTENILNAVQSGVMVIDAETHKIIEVNPAATKIIEAPADEIIGQICHNFVCPAEIGQCPISDKGQETDKSSCVLLTKTGDAKNILKTVVKIKLGERDCLLESFVDITERVRTENLLRESEIYYQAIINIQTDMLYRYFFDGKISFANKAFYQFFGVKEEEVLGETRFKFIPPEFHEDILNVTASLNVEQPVLIHENKNINAQGESRWIHWTNQAILNDAGEIIEYQSVGRDITERKRVERLQKALYAISKAANSASTPKDFYPIVHKIIGENMPAKNFYIALYEEKSDSIQPVYFVDEEDEEPPSHLLAQGLTAYVLKTSEPLLCSIGKFNELLAQEKIIEAGVPSPIWLGVPLITEGQTIGVMAVQHYQDEKAYGQEEKKILEIISSSVSSAIARQLAQEETRTFAQINALLFNAAQEISETLELSTLYHTFYEVISGIIACDLMMISSYNAEEKQIYCSYLIMDGEKQDISKYPPLPLNTEKKRTQSMVIQTGEPRIINDYLTQIKTSKTTYYVDSDGELNDPEKIPKEEKLTRSALIVPLILDGEVKGVIQVMSYNLNAYQENDLHILSALSSHVAVVSNNAYLYEQAQTEINLRIRAEKELQDANLALEERVAKRTKELKERVNMVEKLNSGMSNLLSDLNIANAIAETNAENLKQANAELESFSYSVSHDLRAPLRHIESFAKLLNSHLEEKLDEKSTRYIGHIVESTERMRNLIEDLLTLSRTSRTDLHIKTLDMNGIIESVRVNLLDEVGERSITWKVAPLPLIQADAGFMKILWENLIGNAVKYTQPREKTIIEIDALPSTTSPTFFIRDNGVGFASEYKEQLFNVFERLHKSDDFEGSGVGLATAKRIIERHGGEIWAEGKVDEGATFYFSLGDSI